VLIDGGAKDAWLAAIGVELLDGVAGPPKRLPLLPGGIDMLSGRGGCSRQGRKEIESLKVNRKTR
jgi:hypothetical protein